MSGRRACAMGASLVALCTASAGAQVIDTIFASEHVVYDDLSCPRALVMAADAGPPVRPRAARPTDTLYVMNPPYPRPSMDTTIVLAIDNRDWQRDSYVGGVAMGTENLSRRSGLFTACAGASVDLRHAAVALRGVHGTIRMRADFHALEDVAGRRRGTPFRLSRPGSSTPPAVSPRR